MSEELKSAREFADLIWRLTGTGSDDHGLIYDKWEASIVKAVLSRDKLIEAEVFHNALECLVDEIETGELLTPKLKAALAEHDREVEAAAYARAKRDAKEAATSNRNRFEIEQAIDALQDRGWEAEK